jgi:hypothetical protein
MEPPDLKTLERKLADVRRQVRHLTVMGMRPNLSPEQVALIKKRESVARADLRLRALFEFWKRLKHSTAKPGLLMTAGEHRRMAESLHELGRHQSARGHEHLARFAKAWLAKSTR